MVLEMIHGRVQSVGRYIADAEPFGELVRITFYYH